MRLLAARRRVSLFYSCNFFFLPFSFIFNVCACVLKTRGFQKAPIWYGLVCLCNCYGCCCCFCMCLGLHVWVSVHKCKMKSH